MNANSRIMALTVGLVSLGLAIGAVAQQSVGATTPPSGGDDKAASGKDRSKP